MAKSEPYALGYMSYYSGIPKTGNPYPIDSKEHEEWNKGWDEAKKEAEREDKE